MSNLLLVTHGKGSGAVKGLLSREGAHFLRCDKCVGDEGPWASRSSGNLGIGNYVEFQNIVCC
jgi:hypothetical protein